MICAVVLSWFVYRMVAYSHFSGTNTVLAEAMYSFERLR